MSAMALEGIAVLDLSEDVAGQFCGRLFADNGAEVLLGEPSGGSAVRRRAPLATVSGEEQSCIFWHLNAGKRSVTVDLDSSAGLERVQSLALGADVVIVDPDGRVVDLLDYGQAVVVCDITPFGRQGVLAHWQGSELIYQALSGVMFENGSTDGEPLYGVGERASYAAGAIAYTEALASLISPDAGRQIIDVSIAEVAASMSFNRVTQFAYNRVIEDRDARTIPRAIVRCSDGWMSVFIYDHRWTDSCVALGLDDLIDDPRFVHEKSRLEHWDEFLFELEQRMRSRSVDEVVAAGQREKVVVARAVSPLALRDDPQLEARGFWERSRPGELPRLGPMYRFSDTPQVDRGGAPLPPGPGPAGFHRLGRWARCPDGGAGTLPLEGIRVLDLTTAWSGPMATRILATLGAEVLKVEGPGRMDDWRGPVIGGLPSRYPDRNLGDRPFDRCFQFNTQNHDKRGIALDLKADAGLQLARRLACEADVLIANFSAGTLERMGLGAEQLLELNPRLIVVEMPGYGSGGPMTHYVALGPSMEFACGMATSIGYGDGMPVTTGPAYLDPIGGFNSAAAIMTALAARTKTGRGQHVEVAQREAAMHWIGERIVHAIATGCDTPPDANRIETMAPHGAFPCLGFDEWVAIAVPSDDAFAILCEVIGRPDLSARPEFATLGERRRNVDELDRAVSCWTRARDKHDVAVQLQAAGVPAAPVSNARDVYESTFLRERGLTQEMHHPEAGTHLYQGVPLHISGLDLAIRRPAPTFGEHTKEVLGSVLGLSDPQLLRLADAGVIASRPRGSRAVRAPTVATSELHDIHSGAVRLRARVAGRPGAQPIVLVHGWSQSEQSFNRQFASPLLDEFRLVAFDLRGHGASDAPADREEYSGRTVWAEDLAAVIEQLELERPVLVGWSFGGYVVCDYLRRFGDDEVAGVNFVGWAVMMGNDECAQALIGTAFTDHFFGSVSSDLAISIPAMRSFVRACVERPPEPSELETMVAYNMMVSPQVREAMATCPPVDNTDVLSSLSVPVLLSYGMLDRITRPEAAAYIQRHCPTARVSYYDDVGHSPFFEDAERFNLELADFTARVSRVRQGTAAPQADPVSGSSAHRAVTHDC